jgi:hypothetical protein
MPLTFTPPKDATSKAPSIGAAIPNRPEAKVSQRLMPVARSSLASEFPQITLQLWPAPAFPSQYAVIAIMTIAQLWARP